MWGNFLKVVEKSVIMGLKKFEGGKAWRKRLMFDVWKNVLAEVEQEIPHASYVTWFHDVHLISIENKVVTVGVPNVFKQNQLKRNYDKNIQKALLKNGVEFSEVKYLVQGSSKIKKGGKNWSGREIGPEEDKRIGRATTIGTISSTMKHGGASKLNSTGLNKKYTLDNFVIGSNNDLAVSVAKNVIKSPGEKFNPFFLYGGPGLGKTHLVQAVGNALLAKNPHLKIRYVPTNHFYSEFVDSIMKSGGNEFVKKYRSLDVLIIDDFQMIINKDRSQEQFFNIFNDLYQQNKQIIVTSDRLPSQIQTLDERLASRLTMGGAIDMQMPNFEDKCAILQVKAEFDGVEIEREAIEYLAENVKTNIRDLESEYNTLMAMADLKGVSPLEIIHGGYINPTQNHKRTISPKQVVDKVAKYYDLSIKEICGGSRVAHIKTARQVAMYLLSEELHLSTPKIAREVGLKDHTTAIHGIKKIKNDLKLNFSLREQIAEIREKIYG